MCSHLVGGADCVWRNEFSALREGHNKYDAEVSKPANFLRAVPALACEVEHDQMALDFAMERV